MAKGRIALLARWIKDAARPVILAGGGVIASAAQDELRSLARRYHVPVVMSMPWMGAYPSADPLSLGLCGYAGSQFANLAIHKADLLICIGTTLHVRQTGSLADKTAPHAKIARIDLDRNELAHSRVPLDLEIHGDAREVLDALNALLARSPAPSAGQTKAWLQTVKD